MLSSERGSQLQWHCHGKNVMLSIVRGVHFLHANRVTHRDIKSKNVLLDAHGRAKISDVGLATFTNDPNAIPTIGTLAWAGSAAGEPLQCLSVSFETVCAAELRSQLCSAEQCFPHCALVLRSPHAALSTAVLAAPELLTGGECTMKADLFSLGVVLWCAAALPCLTRTACYLTRTA